MSYRTRVEAAILTGTPLPSALRHAVAAPRRRRALAGLPSVRVQRRSREAG
jgi:hypothetical protein